jgi:thioredoxin 1
MEHLTLETFKEKVFDFEKNQEWKFEGDKPVILKFFAEWCNPCKMLTPIIEDLNKEYEGKIVIYAIDTEEQQELAGLFGINSIPSMLFIPMNEQPQMTQGLLPKETIINIIKDVLKVV